MSSRTLHEVIGRALNVPPASVSDDSSPQTLKRWDSLRHLEVMNSIEDAFAVRFSAGDIMRVKTVGDIRGMLVERGIAVG